MSEQKTLQHQEGGNVSNLDKAKGVAGIAAGGYGGYKVLTNGLPGALGLQVEEHTTSKKNAKKILKDGYLRAQYGGGKGGASDKVGIDGFVKNSQGYVHLTGTQNKKGFIDEMKSAAHKRAQRMLYGAVHSSTDGDVEEGLKNLFKGKDKSKTLYTANPESYYNKNFEADTDSLHNGLKTKQNVRVHGSKLSAALAGIREHGLKGMMESKGRTAAYLAGTGATGYGAVKLIQEGYKDFKGKKD